MRVLVQRVAWAEVEVDGQVVGRIEQGLLVYVGVGVGDEPAQVQFLAEKVANLRIFEDQQGKLNKSVRDVGGALLVVSNFTLLADARKGRRPAFAGAAPADQARLLHERFLDELDRQGVPVETGVFGASMAIRSQAAGPVNIILDAPGAGAQAGDEGVRPAHSGAGAPPAGDA
jgi:D-tyrosyl-tRNA(Tyr) deacylase